MKFQRVAACTLFLWLSSASVASSANFDSPIAQATFVVTCGLDEGTAWQVRPGVYLTANHVVAQCVTAQLVTPGGIVDTRVFRRNTAFDIAELRSSYQAGSSIALAASLPSTGSTLVIRSAPNGKMGTTTGVLVDIEDVSGVPILHTSAQVSPGSSGGVVVDTSQRAVGLVQEELLDGSHGALALRQPYLSEFLSGKLAHTVSGSILPAQGLLAAPNSIWWVLFAFLSGVMSVSPLFFLWYRHNMRRGRVLDRVEIVLGAVFITEKNGKY